MSDIEGADRNCFFLKGLGFTLGWRSRGLGHENAAAYKIFWLLTISYDISQTVSRFLDFFSRQQHGRYICRVEWFGVLIGTSARSSGSTLDAGIT